MSNLYIAKDNERIEQIVYKNYGSLDPIPAVLEDNIHLIGKVSLDAGDKVILNDHTLTETSIIKKTDESKALW